MNAPVALLLALVAGALLGALFFGGLWWTVRRSLVSAHPMLWVLGSMLLRMVFTLGGFYLVAGDAWQRLLACLVGFVLARFVVIRLTRRFAVQAPAARSGACHAP